MDKKIVLGLAGEIASGKTSIAKYLVEKYNGGSHRFSTMLRDVAERMYLEQNRENLQKISTIFRENFSDDILSKVICEDVVNDEHKIIAVDGVRRMPDIEHLKKIPGFKLAYIEADMQKRYERITNRGENADDTQKTFTEFEKDHQREAELMIKDLKKDADIIIDNNGNLADLYSQIDKELQAL